METPFEITVLMVVTVIAGISAQVLGKYLKIPGIVFLLFFGIFLGRDGLGFIDPQLLGYGLEVIVSLSVALILFEGGLSIQIKDLIKISGTLRNLVIFGTLITLIVGGIAAHFLVDLPWELALLYASLVIVTGPTVIGPLLKQVQVERKVATLLESEGVLIDPVGAIIAVLVLGIVLSGSAEPVQLVADLTIRLAIGTAIGGTGSLLLGWFLKRADFLSSDLKNLLVLAGVWGLYCLAQYIENESGLMAVVVAGIVISAVGVPELRLLRRFQGQLTILNVSVLFILLAADLSLGSIVALGWGSVVTVLILMLVVRPLNIWISTTNSDFNWQQKLFISWIGPKGIVSASVASLFAILLAEEGINGGESIKALVFLTIMMTVGIQGLTAQALANILNLSAAKLKGAVIVGSNPLARLIGRLLQERDQSVVLIDTNAQAVKEAQQENLQVFLNSALDAEVLEEAGLDSMGSFLAMTKNGEVNFVLAQRASEEFETPRVLAVYSQNSRDGKSSPRTNVKPALTFDLPLKMWNEYLNNGNVRLIETVLDNPGFIYQQIYLQALIDSGKLIPLLLERQNQLQIVQAGQPWSSGDRIICLLQNPQPKLLNQLSGVSTTRLSLEKLPKVQEISMPALVV
ncbi:MAG: cation:proton antiporter [Prochloraceae cyanobacterium]|nr:cation:proton antiporter [Prochloraceae cyanobacterium]